MFLARGTGEGIAWGLCGDAVYSDQCDENTGQCECKPGVTGRRYVALVFSVRHVCNLVQGRSFEESGKGIPSLRFIT